MMPSSQLLAALVSILIGNLGLIASFAFGGISVTELAWSYWIQSVAFGIAHAVRMQRLKRFTTQGLKSNGRSVPETAAGKRSTVLFFLVHYGFFHLVYAIFLASMLDFGPVRWRQLLWVLLFLAGLIAGEISALREQIETDRRGVPNLGSLLFRPYVRIIPMHLAILGGFAGAAVYLFLTLKVVADAGGVVLDAFISSRTVARGT